MSYRPWIGKHYASGAMFRQRVLIMGESHYGCDDPELTNTEVGRICEGQRYGFFTKIGSALIGLEPYRADPAAFWHSVAFMNLVDESVGDSHTNRPTSVAWRRSRDTFLDRVAALDPHRIIVCGYQAWNELPLFSFGPKDGTPFLESEPDASLCGPYELGRERVAWAMCIKHPSIRCWKADHWRPLIAAFLSTPLSRSSRTNATD